MNVIIFKKDIFWEVVMDNEKIGLFIKKLREDKKLTQEELAKMIPISRQAVSKWERGLTIPDPQILIKLSEIFNLSINEILNGEKINKTNIQKINSISLELYKDSNKKNKIIKLLIFLLFILIFIFLIYYFIISYRSINIYTISGFSDNVNFKNGIFVKTNEKLYFRIGDIEILNNQKIKNIKLFYKFNNKQITILNKSVDSESDLNISFIDYVGYNDYIDTSNLDYIIENMYLNVTFSDFEDNVKVDFVKDYVNDYLFFKNSKNVGIKNNIRKSIDINEEDNEIIKNIKNSTNYKIDNQNYIYTETKNTITKNIFYDDDLKVINISIYDSTNFMESYIYEIKYNMINYRKLEKDLYFKNCKYQNYCDDEQLKILNNFYQNILDSLKT